MMHEIQGERERETLVISSLNKRDIFKQKRTIFLPEVSKPQKERTGRGGTNTMASNLLAMASNLIAMAS